MNMRKTCRIAPLMGIAIFGSLQMANPALGRGSLENPQKSGFESGVGVVSGWHCDAGIIQIQFDDLDPIEASYGTTRNDTESVCGDSDNGFALLWAYSLLGPGEHTVRALADGVEFGSATFEVNQLAEGFLRDLEMRAEMVSLEHGKEFEVTWQQSKQNFVITNVKDSPISVDLLKAVATGTWSGQWQSPAGSGNLMMSFAVKNNGDISVTDLTMTNTGCAENGAAVEDLTDLNYRYVDVAMADDSLIEFEFSPSRLYSALGGTFLIQSGPCANADGAFYLIKE